jgi:hypothetical protein
VHIKLDLYVPRKLVFIPDCGGMTRRSFRFGIGLNHESSVLDVDGFTTFKPPAMWQLAVFVAVEVLCVENRFAVLLGGFRFVLRSP